MKSLVLTSAILAALIGSAPAAKAYGWVHCATEGGYCSAPNGAIIHYGRDGVFTRLRSPRSGLPCDNSVFGDPLRGVHKECYFSY